MREVSQTITLALQCGRNEKSLVWSGTATA
jgi:hypothetical protein